MTGLQDQRAHLQLENSHSLSPSDLAELTINGGLRYDDRSDVSSNVFDGCAALLRKVILMSFPDMPNTESAIRPQMHTRTKENVPTRKTVLRHFRNSAKAETS